MKKNLFCFAILLCLCVLSACAADSSISTPSQEEGNGTPAASQPEENSLPPEGETITCRVVEEDDGLLLLARPEGNSGDIYRLTLHGVSVENEGAENTEVEEGALVEVTFSGAILESYPASFDGVTGVKVLKNGFDNLSSLYLEVLDDLWDADPGLNSNLTQLGVDLSATRLSASERAAVIWAFGEDHGFHPVQGTWQELADQGYIDAERLVWEGGCLFSIEEQASEEKKVEFEAKKWSSGTGAYFFTNCTSVQSPSGEWGDYKIGSEMIS